MQMNTSVLWIINMVLPELANHLGIKTGNSGTWMFDLSRKLVDQEGCRLAIACVYGDKFAKYDINGITYYTLPGKPSNMYFYTKRFESLWAQINVELSPTRNRWNEYSVSTILSMSFMPQPISMFP